MTSADFTIADKLAGESWIEWSGGKCPVDASAIVQVQYRPLHPSLPRGISTPARASWFQIGTDWWQHKSPNRTNDILAYRQVSA